MSSPVSVALAATPEAISMADVLELDVGGFPFKTTRKTLCAVAGSMLEAMFSGRHANAAIHLKDGSFFIDRDGRHFQHILNFLRVGGVPVSLPTSPEAKEALAVEAEYFGLLNLVQALRPSRTPRDYEGILSDEMQSIRATEKLARSSFVSPGSLVAPGVPPFDGLIPLFRSDSKMDSDDWKPVYGEDQVIVAPLRFKLPATPPNKSKQASETFLADQTTIRNIPGQSVTVTYLQEFRANLNAQHSKVLKRLDPILKKENILIAGGAVLKALTLGKGLRTNPEHFLAEQSKGDIDLFVYSTNAETATRVAQEISFALSEDWIVFRGRHVLNFVRERLEGWKRVREKIQIVLRLYESPVEILFGFDLDCCCCAYDGHNVWISERCRVALESGRNILNPLHSWPNKGSYELRLAKYASRGCPIWVPGFKREFVDWQRINQSVIGDLKGLARLVKVEMELSRGLVPPSMDYGRNREMLENVGAPKPSISQVDSLWQELKKLTVTEDGYYDESRLEAIVPSVYGDQFDWWWDVGFIAERDAPPFLSTRTAAWNEILDYQLPLPPGLPRRLLDAWKNDKRSREYLNDTMEKFELDNLYYEAAYAHDKSYE